MNNLPSVYQSIIPKIYYVYLHTDPETNKIVYIGKGSRGRAWHCAESNSRSEEHSTWMNNLILQGFTPDSWVTILESSLSEEDAFSLEKELIDKYKPKYNSKKDSACKLSQTDLIDIKTLRELGWSYEKISTYIGYSTMTVFRAYNGRTKNYVI